MNDGWRVSKERGRALRGVGLGLRWEFLDEVLARDSVPVAFFEVAPENFMRRGGYFPEALVAIGKKVPLLTHGLSMSLGAVDLPPTGYLSELKREIARVGSPFHSDHLCLSTAGPFVLHELLPLHQTAQEASRVAANIKQIQERLGCPLAIENVSFYAQPAKPELSEAEFISAVLHQSGAGLLLDVNNVYVNAKNHGYNPLKFIQELPLNQVVCLHVAGHELLPPSHPAAGLYLDTHGAEVAAEVMELFAQTLALVGPVPVVLERDNHVPELDALLEEVAQLRNIYEGVLGAGTDEQPADVRPVDERVVDVSSWAGTPVGPRSIATGEGFSAPWSEEATLSELAPLERFYLELCLGPGEEPLDVTALLARAQVPPAQAAWILAHGAPRLPIYRRLVQQNFQEALRAAIPQMAQRLGETFAPWVSRFFQERAPLTHYLRDFTFDFIAFVEERSAATDGVEPYLFELARLEALRIVVAAAPGDEWSSRDEPADAAGASERLDSAEPPEICLTDVFEFSGSVRLFVAQHRVHELLDDHQKPARRGELRLVLYRDASRDVRYLEVNAFGFALMTELLAGATLKDAVVSAAEPVAAQALTDAGALLGELSERGLLLGRKQTGSRHSIAGG